MNFPEIEEIAGRDPLLYEVLRKITRALNTNPIQRGSGAPEGNVAAPPGQIYVANDPVLGDAAYIKLAGNDENGWAVLGNSLSGILRFPVTFSGSTSSGTYVTVKDVDAVLPPNLRRLVFQLAVTGDGAGRIKLGSAVSNEIAGGSGAVTLYNAKTGLLEVQARANAGSVTATLTVIGALMFAGDQMTGARVQPANQPRSTPGPPGGESGQFVEVPGGFGRLFTS